MSPKRGERVAPPAGQGLWELRFATTEAAKGWDELCRSAPANALVAFEELRRRATSPAPTNRHHPLKGDLATGTHKGETMAQWQYEITSGGRIWYLVDTARHTLWFKYASTSHPTITDR